MGHRLTLPLPPDAVPGRILASMMALAFGP